MDGVVFTAVLPPRFGFVIKREMDRVPLAGLLLRRLGSLFVERSNRQRGANDARRVLRTAINGSSLVFFPEGTFSPAPGLLKFHVGVHHRRARRLSGGAGGGPGHASGFAARRVFSAARAH